MFLIIKMIIVEDKMMVDRIITFTLFDSSSTNEIEGASWGIFKNFESIAVMIPENKAKINMGPRNLNVSWPKYKVDRIIWTRELTEEPIIEIP